MRPVRVAGLVLLRQRPGTAKGITFVTLEDETGTMNLVVHQHMWDRYYRIARRAPAWIAHGHIQTAPQSEVPIIHVVVNRLEALAEQLHAARCEIARFSLVIRITHQPAACGLANVRLHHTLSPASQPVLNAA